MAFFSRPNLDDFQFKQLSGSTLTLSGNTIFNNVTGLTLMGDSEEKIPIIVTGATNNKVLTYYNGKIVLMSGGTGGGDGLYCRTSPTTCTVGGLSCGCEIYEWEITKILECIVAPVLEPTLTPNSYILCENSPTSVYKEVGSVGNINVRSVYNRGCVNPRYNTGCTCSFYRTGTVCYYMYEFYKSGEYECVCQEIPAISILCDFEIIYGNNNRIRGNAYYRAGVPPYNSNCQPMDEYCCPAGSLTSCISKTGVYPYFWGVTNHTGSFSNNSCYQNCLINNSCGCYVCPSNGSVVVDNYNTSGNRIWIAIPNCGGNIKTKWQGGNSAENKGNIPQTNGLFANGSVICNIPISSPNGLWSNEQYTFYISSYATSIDYSMTFS